MKSRIRLSIVLLAAAIAACDVQRSGPTQTLPEALPTTFRSTAGTLEQTVSVQHPSIAPDEPRIISFTGWVENKGALGQNVTARVCSLLVDDLSAEGVQFIEQDPVCEENVRTMELKAGERTPQMMGRFQLVASPGLYTIRVRQLLSPNSVTEIQTRIR